MKRLKSYFSMMVLFIAANCAKSPTDSKEMPRNPREYKWTVDTLAYPGSFQTSMRDMWGSSSQYIYVVGHNDQPGPGTMFHFDGTNWRTTRFHAAEGGLIQGPVSLSAIYGFSANDIWAVGEHIYVNPNRPPNFLDSSLVIHYDGSKWTEAKNPRYKGIFGIWGSSPTNVYAVGRQGIVLHYDGAKWSSRFLSPPAALGAFGGDAGRLFAGGSIQAGGLDTLVVFTNTGNGWQLINRLYRK